MAIMAGKNRKPIFRNTFYRFSLGYLMNKKSKSRKIKANDKDRAREIIRGEIAKKKFMLAAAPPSSEQEQERTKENDDLEKPVLKANKRTNKGYIEMQCPHCQAGFQINPKSINIPLPKKKKSKRVEPEPLLYKCCMRIHKLGNMPRLVC